MVGYPQDLKKKVWLLDGAPAYFDLSFLLGNQTVQEIAAKCNVIQAKAKAKGAFMVLCCVGLEL